MSKKRKLRPFYRRLTRWIGLSQLIVMALASYLIYLLAAEVFKEEEFDMYEKSLQVTEKDVRRVLSDVYVGATNHVPEIEANLDHPDKLHNIMQRVVELNPHIRSCGLSFIADYYPQKGHWFCPYAVKDEDGKIECSTIGDSKHDYLNAAWFTEALEADSSYWSKPFMDSRDTITPLVSYMVPIHNKQGKTVAILGADMSLYKFSGRLMRGLSLKGDTVHVSYTRGEQDDDNSANSFRTLKEQLGSFEFIIDHDGTYIAVMSSGRTISSWLRQRTIPSTIMWAVRWWLEKKASSKTKKIMDVISTSSTLRVPKSICSICLLNIRTGLLQWLWQDTRSTPLPSDSALSS